MTATARQIRTVVGQIARIEAVLAEPMWADQHEYQSKRLAAKRALLAKYTD